MLGLFQGGQRTFAKTFVTGVELLDDAQLGPFPGLLPQQAVQLRARLRQLILERAQPGLPLLDAPPLGLGMKFFRFDVGRKLLQPRFQARSLLLELNFLGREFFEPDHIALLLEVQRGDFVAHAGQILRRGEGLRLGLAQRFLRLAQLVLDLPQAPLFLLEGLAMPRHGTLRVFQVGRHRGQFLPRDFAPFLGLGDVGQRLRVLRGQFFEPFLVELDAALEAVHLAFQLHALLLPGGDVVLELRQPVAQLGNLVFGLEHGGGAAFNLGPQLFGGGLPLLDFRLQDIELVPGQLGVQVLQLRGQLLVAPGLARLPLQRSDLPLHLPHQVRHPQEVLLGVFQLSESLFLLGLVLGDPRRFFEDHPPVFGFARENLRDVALGHDAVAGPAHPRAHEQLLNVLQAAGSLVDEILAAAVAEHPPGNRNLIVGNFHTCGGEVFGVHTTDCEGHLSHPQWLAAVGPVEDDIGHLAPAKRLGRLLAQYPTDCVGHVRLATPIGADDGRHPRLKIQGRLVRKGFKSQDS